MIDYKLLGEAFVYFFYASGVVGVLFICEIMLGESVRDYLKRFRKKDDAGEGSK
tara:strand:+ start:65 stop:226 length:162 start_codon:yes stop_codon:yes gene_type:complete